MAPDLGQTPETSQPIHWRAVGQAWTNNTQVRLEYALTLNGDWQEIASTLDAMAADGVLATIRGKWLGSLPELASADAPTS